MTFGRYRWLVFSLAAAGYLMVYFHRLCPAVVALDMMEDLGAGGALMGFLAAAYFYPYALMQIPSGLLSDSWGPRKTISFFFSLAGLGAVILGLAPSAWVAVLARVLVGLGVAMLFVPTLKLLTRWFTPDEFATMTGWLMAVGGLGALFASAPLALVSQAVGWRGSFLLIGTLTVLAALAIFRWVRNEPEERGFAPVVPRDRECGAGRACSLKHSLKTVLSTPAFWPLAVWFFFTFGIFFSFAGLWGGPYLMQAHFLSKGEAGSVLSMMAAAMIIACPLLGPLSTRVLRSRKKVLVGSSAGVLLLSLFPVLADGPASLFTLHVWSFCFGVCANAVVVIGFSAVKELYPVEMAGTAVGLMNLFPFLAGAIMQPLVGYVLDRLAATPGLYLPSSYKTAFWLYVVSAAAALIGALFSRETIDANL